MSHGQGVSRAISVALLLVHALACGGGGKHEAQEVVLVGRVFGADRGTPLAEVEVQLADGQTVKTDREGRFALRHREQDKAVVRAEREGYVPVIKGAPKGDGYLELFVKDVDATAELAVKKGGRVSIQAGASLSLPQNGLLAKGGATSAMAKVELAGPDPHRPGALGALPGDFDARQGGKVGKLSVESPVYIRARGSDKRELSLRRDKRATLALPARRAGSSADGALFRFDAAQQAWLFVKKVKRSVTKARASDTYTATIDELGWWTVGELFDALTCIRACVVDSKGQGVPYARAVATGVDHFTQLSTYADADGCFALDVRAKAQISLAVQAIDGLVEPRVLETFAAGPSALDNTAKCQDLGKLELEHAQPSACPLGFRACGEACVDLRSDSTSCGACDEACESSPGRELSCIDGVCSCPLGQRSCASQATGAYCAVLRSDDLNCGGCNLACDAQQTCLEGECTGRAADGDAGVTSGDDAGIAGPPSLDLAPKTQAFGPTLTSQSSAGFAFTITNAGGSPATGCSAPTLSGPSAADFAIVSDGCGTSDLAAGESCVVTVSATPSAGGERTASLSRSCAAGGTVETAANGLFVNRPHYLFITSTEGHTGNLGGLSGADQICETQAAAGSLSSVLGLQWRALLSISGVVDARDRVTWTGPVFDIRNLLATSNPTVWPWAIDGVDPGGAQAELLAADENGASVGSYVWTGTHEDGTAQSNDCLGWTSSDSGDSGHAGQNGSFTTSTGWLSSFSNGCADAFFALICVSDGPNL